ncbi:MAG: hypothetical protein OEP95_01455 [Myxococcales bacterium]|nr:hypothetical protein [Myxococcales bacterium]
MENPPAATGIEESCRLLASIGSDCRGCHDSAGEKLQRGADTLGVDLRDWIQDLMVLDWEPVLTILRRELETIMHEMGTANLPAITGDFVRHRQRHGG